MCHEPTAHKMALEEFLAADVTNMVLRAGASLVKQDTAICIDYCGQGYEVILSTGEVIANQGQPVSLKDATLILQYLTKGSGLPPRGKWLSFLELPLGENHYAPFLIEACNPLAQAFAEDAANLKQKLLNFGGQPLDMGDFAVYIPAFPKLPLAVVLWEGDDEFPAKAVILYDSVAPHQLPTAALYVLGIELTKKLVQNN